MASEHPEFYCQRCGQLENTREHDPAFQFRYHAFTPSPPSSGEGAKTIVPEFCPHGIKLFSGLACGNCHAEQFMRDMAAYNGEPSLELDSDQKRAQAGVEVEREEFEKWHKAKYPMTALEYDEPENEYSDVYADQRWVGWQAARASRGEK